MAHSCYIHPSLRGGHLLRRSLTFNPMDSGKRFSPTLTTGPRRAQARAWLKAVGLANVGATGGFPLGQVAPETLMGGLRAKYAATLSPAASGALAS